MRPTNSTDREQQLNTRSSVTSRQVEFTTIQGIKNYLAITGFEESRSRLFFFVLALTDEGFLDGIPRLMC